ncbi:hypothetical protein [Streptomyces sp. NPDC051452]|uniref:hypothetical protein n=1 Tax=Streptomyces sp. NPDC051452 TaxID=3365654 RepID=UPI0037953180
MTPVHDGMAEEIRTFDAMLDPARGQGLLTALDLMRADAAAAGPRATVHRILTTMLIHRSDDDVAPLGVRRGGVG